MSAYQGKPTPSYNGFLHAEDGQHELTRCLVCFFSIGWQAPR